MRRLVHDRAAMRRLVEEVIAPRAARADAIGELDAEMLARLAEEGFCAWSSEDSSALSIGWAHEAIGRVCGSTRAVLTVHAMVVAAIERFGTASQRALLEELRCGRWMAAFALSEPGVGSDPAAVTTRAEADGEWVRIDGVKRWVTNGQRAALFLVFARTVEGPTAYLVPREARGLHVIPMPPAIGLRASMLAELRLERCTVPASARLGPPGGGVAFVAAHALDLGRYLVAWGSVGAMAACAEAALAYARTRVQHGAPIGEHQLVQRRLTRMIARSRFARALCTEVAALRDRRDPMAARETMLAKYVATCAATEVAEDAVQVHGAAGLTAGMIVERHLRDARVGEIIEGSTEMCETTLARAWLASGGSDV